MVEPSSGKFRGDGFRPRADGDRRWQKICDDAAAISNIGLCLE